MNRIRPINFKVGNSTWISMEMIKIKVGLVSFVFVILWGKNCPYYYLLSIINIILNPYCNPKIREKKLMTCMCAIASNVIQFVLKPLYYSLCIIGFMELSFLKSLIKYGSTRREDRKRWYVLLQFGVRKQNYKRLQDM